MINNIELEIISKFVNKSKRERFIYELGNSKKREHIMLKRFAKSNSHDANKRPYTGEPGSTYVAPLSIGVGEGLILVFQ